MKKATHLIADKNQPFKTIFFATAVLWKLSRAQLMISRNKQKKNYCISFFQSGFNLSVLAVSLESKPQKT